LQTFMDPIWFPSHTYTQGSYLEALAHRLGLENSDTENQYQALYAYSIAQPETFWDATLALLGIEWNVPYSRVLDSSAGPQWPNWFVGGKLNLTHNALRHAAMPERKAIIWEGEDGSSTSLNYLELEAEVGRAAAGLLALGVSKGDRVGMYMPMIPETAIAALAVAAIGAILVPIFSGYAPEATAARLVDAGAKLLITADGFYRRGQQVNLLHSARLAQNLAEIKTLLVVQRFGTPLKDTEVVWGFSADTQAPVAMASMDPFMLIYTSGTTGKPKGTVHYHAGFPLKAAQDLAHLFDLRPNETLFWFTDMGWMMGPWAIFGALTLGATVVLYEGAPDYPDASRLWELCAKHGVTHLGLSPTLVRALMVHGEDLVKKADLSKLRVLGSTGEPWNLGPYMWFSGLFQNRLPIVNYSGGTEVGGGILGCTLHRPIYPMGFNTAVPGIQAQVLNSSGQPVQQEVGELAVLAPWPGQTKGFWQSSERYLQTYWKDGNVWMHGDWATVENNHWSIQGRSDDTLKIAGKRVGPAEYESAAVAHPAVKEAAAIGIPHDIKGEAAVVFVVLKEATDLAQVSQTITNQLGKALKAQRIIAVPDLPKTRNAKVMRRVIRAVFLGLEPGDLSALENPAAVEGIREALKD
jgi:acetyl-CoA synthetase